jgi:mannosylglycoprotein endo-beta-mannosidase
VWQEFWITGDCNGRGVEPSDPDWPLDHDLFLTCAYDTVKLLRNHASLALWCGGNEQHPADDINEALEKNLKIVSEGENPSLSLDGSRLYIQGRLLYK